jgi:hypothetical protein
MPISVNLPYHYETIKGSKYNYSIARTIKRANPVCCLATLISGVRRANGVDFKKYTAV